MPSIISDEVWSALVSANERAVANGWAEPGVFGPGVGPAYEVGGHSSVLYVGKSAGPLGSRVGSSFDQALNAEASHHRVADGWTLIWQHMDGPRAIITKHPQGWPSKNRQAVMDVLISGSAHWLKNK